LPNMVSLWSRLLALQSRLMEHSTYRRTQLVPERPTSQQSYEPMQWEFARWQRW
jgi:hypothetical protein